jgi:hypothetical protein
MSPLDPLASARYADALQSYARAPTRPIAGDIGQSPGYRPPSPGSPVSHPRFGRDLQLTAPPCTQPLLIRASGVVFKNSMPLSFAAFPTKL